MFVDLSEKTYVPPYKIDFIEDYMRLICYTLAFVTPE